MKSLPTKFVKFCIVISTVFTSKSSYLKLLVYYEELAKKIAKFCIVIVSRFYKKI
jgi:hypothetical protein